MTRLNLRYFFFLVGLLASCGFIWPFDLFNGTPNLERYGSNAWISRETQILQSNAHNVNPTVLKLSLIAYMKARAKGLDRKELLTVIDFSKPSTEKRLWVFDLRRNRTLYNTWVSHGKNSGGIMASSFSNNPGSLKSSLGVFVTDQPYYGDNGYSLRLTGLEPGVNDNAYRRAIVIHGAHYVDADIIRRFGNIGRSWGCPAISTTLSRPLIDQIKANTIVFAYYPDRYWLSHSRFLA